MFSTNRSGSRCHFRLSWIAAVIRNVIAAALLLAIAGFSARPAWGQAYSGTLTGVVTDPSGAVVPDAKVVVTDTAKGVAYTAATDSSGRYLVRALPPSGYRLAVEVQGFKTYVQDGVVLAVNQNASVDVVLTLGTGSQSVEVQAAGIALATQDAVTVQELDRKLINELPLLGRNVFDLAGLAPGITQASGGFTIAYHATNFISDGSRNAQTDVLMDGVSTTNYENGTGVLIPLYQPSVDAVQEFKVQQSGFSADIGFSASTVMNVVTRSGTNQFHGSASWFLRNNILTANNWFANANDQPMAGRHYNRFGGTIGGPIKKDKTFFFVNIEGLIDISATTFQSGVPSAAERKGDFGEICGAGFDSAGLCKDPNGQLWDPYTGIYNPAWGVPVRLGYIPFNNMATYTSPGSPRLNGTGQQLPAGPGNLMDPAALKLMQYFPLPNMNVGQPNYNRRLNWFSVGNATEKGYQGDFKLDHSFSEKDRSSAKFSRQSGDFSGSNPYGNVFNPTFTGPAVITAHLFALNHTHTISPTTLLSASYGFTRQFTDQRDVATNFKEDPISLLGLPDYMRESGFKTSPAIILPTYASPAVNIGSVPFALLRQGTETHDLNGSISRLQGRHELKAGGGARMHRINFVQPGAPGGLFVFPFVSTAEFYAMGGGDDMASFLTGIGYTPASYYSMPAFVSTQNLAFAGYLQDNWRVTDRLTLNLGVRYDIETPRTERYNRQSYFDPDMNSPLNVPGLPNLKGGLQFVDSGNRHPYGWDNNNWAPRFGFAYRLNNTTVMRGGYGIFYSTTIRGAAGTGGGGAQGFSRNTSWITNFQQDGQTPCCRLSDPFPGTGPLLPPGSTLGALSFVGDSITGSPMRSSALDATPYEQTWSFGFQKDVAGGVLIDTTYIGKKGTKLYFGGTGDMNHLGPEIEQYTAAQIKDLETYVPNPFFGNVPATAPLGGPTILKYQLLRPYPQFQNLSSQTLPVADSSYHALQVKAEKRFSHGLQMLATYTWSKSIDDSSVGGLSWLAGIWANVQDPNNRRLERSVSSFDIPQVLGLSYVYELPFGRGKSLGGNWPGAINAILGGWKTNGILRFSTGQPLSLYLSQGQPLPTYGSQRPNLTADLEKTSNADFRTQYFANPDVVEKPAPFTLGNAPRTITSVRSPGVNSANLSLLKMFDLNMLVETMKLELRAEAFNALNHPQFCGPNTTIDSGNFGLVSSTCNAPREVQLGMRLTW
jgi:hypothetical protein